MAEKLSGSDARQGSRGKPAFYVLLASMVMHFLATISLMLWNGAEAPRTYHEVAAGATGGQPNGGSSARTSGVPAANPAYPAPAAPRASP